MPGNELMEPRWLNKLVDLIEHSFSTRELLIVCSEFDIDYEAIAGEGKRGKIRQLLLLLASQEHLSELLVICQRQRPHIKWPDIDRFRDETIDVAKEAAPGGYSVNIGGDVSGSIAVGSNIGKVMGSGSPVPLRLDAALPDQVFLGRSFELAVAVRQPDSPVLNEADLNQTKSGNLLVTWPEEYSSVRLSIHVSAPECTIYNQAYSFQLSEGHDSPVFYFQLTPNQAGRIGIVVTVYQERDWLGGTRLHTLVKEQVAGQVEIEVFSRPIAASQETLVNVALQIKASFSPPELRTLCFDMGVSHDDLRGETHAERVRELVAHMVRRGRFHTLLQQCQKKRSHIDWLALAGITTTPA